MDANFTDRIFTPEQDKKIIVKKYTNLQNEKITIGSTISYFIEISNISEFRLESVCVFEDIIDGLKYKLNSLKINNRIPFEGDIDLNKEAIIPIGTINPMLGNNRKFDILLTFDVIVEKIPRQNPISNYVRVLYKYKNRNRVISEIESSNKVDTEFSIDNQNNGLIQYIDGNNLVSSKEIGESVEFDIVIRPSATIRNVYLCDYLNENLNFVSASISYNNNKINNINTYQDKIFLDTINKGDVVNVHISSTLSACNTSCLTNTAILNFQGNNNSLLSIPINSVYLYVKKSNLVCDKKVNKDYANVGDIVTFDIKLKNEGTVLLEDILVSNILSDSLEYINNSATILYKDLLSCSINYNQTYNNFKIPFLDVDEEVFIRLDAKVLPIRNSNENVVKNKTDLTYSYIKNPQENEIDKQYNTIRNVPMSKKHHPCVKKADLLSTLKKSLSKNYNCKDSTLEYTISFTNTGNIDACNIVLSDVLNNAIFKPDSLVIKTNMPVGPKKYTGKFPKIYIDKVVPNETITMSFLATVEIGSYNEQVTNYAKLCYQYDNNYCEPVKAEGKTNLVVTEIEAKKLVSNLLINGVTNLEAEVNNEILYTVNIKNTSNDTLYNVSYMLKLTNDYMNNLQYKPNSLKIKGGTPPSLNINPNTSPINLGIIKPKETVIIEFTEIALKPTLKPIISYLDGIYSYNPGNQTCYDKTNETSLYINSPKLNLLKQAYSYCNPNDVGCISKPITSVGINDTITYKITLENTSSSTLENLYLNDSLPNNLTYINGSLKIDNKPVGFDLTLNLYLGSLAPYGKKVVTFDVLVGSGLDTSNLENIACVNYEYLENPNICKPTKTKVCASNNLKVQYADLTQLSSKVSSNTVVSPTDPATNSGTYTISLTNTGNIDAINVKILDTLPSGLTFVPNSVVVSGIDKNGNPVTLKTSSIPPGGPLNIQNGIIIATIASLVTANITFGYTVNSNATGTIVNNATFEYNYVVDGNVVNKPNNLTPDSEMFVLNDVISVNKTSSPQQVCPGDTLLYTVEIKNLTNSQISNIVLQDTLPFGTSLISSSFLVDFKPLSTTITNGDLARGINIGNISSTTPNTKIVQYQVKTNSNIKNPVINTANITYKNSSVRSKTYSSTSTVPYSLNCPIPPPEDPIEMFKQTFSYCPLNAVGCVPNKVSSASIGDTITYKIPIKNLTTETLTNVSFNDYLPSGITYINGSLAVNGVSVVSGVLPTFSLGNIAPGETKIVSFNVLVNSIPTSSQVSNTSCIIYTYKSQQKTYCASNNLSINSADLATSLKKYVDKVGTTVNYKNQDDFITYIVKFSNTGNKDAYNVVLTDSIPPQVGYFVNSVTVTPSVPSSNIIQPTSENKVLKILFNTVPVGTAYTVTFQTGIASTIVSGAIYNNSNLTYSSTSSSTGSSITTNVFSNTVVSYINSGNVEMTKAASASEVDINVPVTYTLTLKNTGNVNVDNLFVYDILPPFVNYIPNTLKVNGLPNSSDINSGVLIGNLKPYTTIANGPISTITFEVLATTTPQINPIINTAFAQYTYSSDPTSTKTELGVATSNQVFLTITAANLISETPIKQSDVSVVSPSNPANNSGNYTVKLYNAGNAPALNVKVLDTLPQGLIFVPNSVTVSGTDKNGNAVQLQANSIPPGGPLNIENGITIASIPPYVTATVKYGYTTSSTVPSQIDNIATFDYSYFVANTIVNKPNNPTNVATIFSVEQSINITKYVTPTTVCPGGSLLYTVNITNASGSTIPNIVFQDTLPSGVNLVPKAFLLNTQEIDFNGTPITNDNLAKGIDLGTLGSESIFVVQYLVSVGNLSAGTPIVNTANLSYINGTIPSIVFASTAVATIANNCPDISPITCPNPQPNPCHCHCGSDCKYVGNYDCCNNCNCNCNYNCKHNEKQKCKPFKKQNSKRIKY